MAVGTSFWDSSQTDIGEEELKQIYSQVGGIYSNITAEVGKVVVGQKQMLDEVLIALLTDSHVLIEGYPGLAKTLLVKTLSNILALDFKRIQCTPDLMPTDITGTYVVEDKKGDKVFRFERGPVFTNLLLADEINRATPKTQSALLEAMQERQVTAGRETFKLEAPFLVLATQNPIEMEGTYPLPEAQVDRFLLKINVGYPQREEEDRIVELYTQSTLPHPGDACSIWDCKPGDPDSPSKRNLVALQQLTRLMPVSAEVREHAIDLVLHTRKDRGEAAKQYLEYGASPRASIGLVMAAKAYALLNGRNYVAKEDVDHMAYPVLRHRIILNFESERKGLSPDDVITQVSSEV
ncbi:MAG: AAA domain-containing protein [Candidatus Altiarchaeales archaeon]|nr:AAA domain-containing protein [Candidatus Altiarchaeales archaeon]